MRSTARARRLVGIVRMVTGVVAALCLGLHVFSLHHESGSMITDGETGLVTSAAELVDDDLDGLAGCGIALAGACLLTFAVARSRQLGRRVLAGRSWSARRSLSRSTGHVPAPNRRRALGLVQLSVCRT
ncbi:hypothetical protein [Microlunatus sp. GCM10028923]|uniref:hypothetical protein n=1 Tax=Microlunatus sp. GCM10028923 TaxID=3273400 RepID=UPI0036115FAC